LAGITALLEIEPSFLLTWFVCDATGIKAKDRRDGLSLPLCFGVLVRCVSRCEVVINASEFYFSPSKVTVPAGRVKFIIVNIGNYSHGLAPLPRGLKERAAKD